MWLASQVEMEEKIQEDIQQNKPPVEVSEGKILGVGLKIWGVIARENTHSCTSLRILENELSIILFYR